MKTVLFAVCLFLATSAPAQTSLVVKDTPSSQALNKTAKDLQDTQKAYDAVMQQAKASLDTEQKATSEKLAALFKELNDRLNADKKYKTIMERLAALQKQLNDSTQTVQARFGPTVVPLQGKLNDERALTDSLTSIVRKENDLPVSATFDPVTQTWKK